LQRIINNMEHRTRISKHPIAGFFVRNTPLWRQLVLLLTFMINIIILATWDADVNYTERKPITPDWCVHTCVSRSVRLLENLCETMARLSLARFGTLPLPLCCPQV
jgi:hypothetical protein